MIDLKDIHPIGIGTWTISNKTKEKDLKGLLYSFKHGQNQIEVNASYLSGETLEVVSEFISKVLNIIKNILTF